MYKININPRKNRNSNQIYCLKKNIALAMMTPIVAYMFPTACVAILLFSFISNVQRFPLLLMLCPLSSTISSTLAAEDLAAENPLTHCQKRMLAQALGSEYPIEGQEGLSPDEQIHEKLSKCRNDKVQVWLSPEQKFQIFENGIERHHLRVSIHDKEVEVLCNSNTDLRIFAKVDMKDIIKGRMQTRESATIILGPHKQKISPFSKIACNKERGLNVTHDGKPRFYEVKGQELFIHSPGNHFRRIFELTDEGGFNRGLPIEEKGQLREGKRDGQCVMINRNTGHIFSIVNWKNGTVDSIPYYAESDPQFILHLLESKGNWQTPFKSFPVMTITACILLARQCLPANQQREERNQRGPVPLPRIIENGDDNTPLYDDDFLAILNEIDLPDNLKQEYNNLKCKISHELMRVPVVFSDGFVYERDSISGWVKAQQHGTLLSPTTGKSIKDNQISMIHSFESRQRVKRFIEAVKETDVYKNHIIQE